MTDRQTTHAQGCWSWGLRHYECAVGQVERDDKYFAIASERIAEAYRKAAAIAKATGGVK